MIRGDIRTLAAYHVPDSSGMIKLDAMENPYPMPDALHRDWSECMVAININRYPDTDMQGLRDSIAALDDVDSEQVLIGNGSDEIIQMLLIAADAGACVVPHPSFVMYEMISQWLKRPVAKVPLDVDFGLDADAFLQVCSREKAAITFLACPNNPTGNMWPTESICQIADNFRGLVVIDEAYWPFSGQSHTDLIARNVLILRTFSKLGWAGLRLGYVLGHEETIADLNKVRLPYNIGSLTQASAQFLLGHLDVYNKQAKKICAERARLSALLGNLEGVEVFPSRTNFLLIRLNNADDAFGELCKRGILVKSLHTAGGLLKNCLRVTIGLPEENDSFVSALKEIIA